MVVVRDGRVWCWGEDSSGQVGDGEVGPYFPNGAAPDRVPDPVVGLPADAVRVEGGDMMTCALLVDDTVWCWGADDVGQLGDGGVDAQPRPVPQPVTGLPGTVIDVAAGFATACALLSSGEPLCWGDDHQGMLGDGVRGPDANPVPSAVTGVPPLVDLDASFDTVCGVTAPGEVWCWGDDPTTIGDDDDPSPRRLAGLPAVAQVAVGRSHVCVITVGNRSILCFGVDIFGQLGDGTLEDPLFRADLRAIEVSGPFATVDAEERHTCASTMSGLAYCWGDGTNGKLGHGLPFEPWNPVPGLVLGLPTL